ncbi:MAG: AAA family ATPase [Saprospiraceae bacterium]|nr:AAA family ATPase [Saprospiraceae bacterium]
MSNLKLFQSIPFYTLSEKQFQALELALINPNLSAKAFTKLFEKINTIDEDVVDKLLNQLSLPPNNDKNDYREYILNKIETLQTEYNLKLTNEAIKLLIKKSETFEAAIAKTLQNPEILNHRVSRHVRGQEELIGLLSAHFYQWQLFWRGKLKTNPTSIPLLIGGTGTGKTFTISKFAEALDAGIINIDASKLVTEGYVGPQISTEIVSRYNNLTPERRERVIVFIDEVDKLSKQYVQNADVKGNNVLFELLTILEGDKISGRPDYNRYSGNITINSTQFCYIFAGAFTGLERKGLSIQKTIGFSPSTGSDDSSVSSNATLVEDVIRYGIPSEIVGRIGWVMTLKPMSAEIYKDILLHSSSSPLLYYKELYAIHAMDFMIHDDDINVIIASAIEKNLGVRGVRHAMNDYFNARFNSDFGQNYL